VPEYPGIYVEEIVPGKSIEGVPTGTSAFVELIRRSAGAIVKAAVVLLGVLIGAAAAVTVDKAMRRRCRRARSDSRSAFSPRQRR
jgi:hypothetical protein